MATKSSFDIHSTYYESFLALSVSLRVNKHQLKMESHTNQAPVLRYRDITVTSESLRESLAVVCPVLGVHNVARVKRGTLALFEVDFTEQKALERFCKSMDGLLQSRLHDHLKPKLSPGQKLEVTVKLHLFIPNADKKDPQLREVTSDNCQECFSLLRESALFEFGAFDLSHPIPPDEESGRRELTIDDLREVLQELIEAAALWFTVGVFLGVPYHTLEAIRKNHHDQCMECLSAMLAAWLRGTEALPAAVVQALRAAGMVVLARKIAVKYGVTVIVESITTKPGVELSGTFSGSASELITFFSKQTTMADQSSRAQPVQVIILKTLADQREGLATKEVKCSEISQQLDHLRKKEKEVNESLEDTKSSLGSVKDQIDKLKCRQESLIREREKKESQKRWLMKQKDSMFGEELVAVKQLIEDTEKAVIELSEKIDELEEKTRTLEEEAEQMKLQLLKQETDKDELQLKVEEIQKEKETLENTLAEDRREFEKEIERMALELKLKEGKMEVMQIKVEMMQDELSHRRKEVEIALTATNTAPPMGYNQQTGQQGDYPGPYFQFQQEYHPTQEAEPEALAPIPIKLSPPPPPVPKRTPHTSNTAENTRQLEDQPCSEQHYVVQRHAMNEPPEAKDERKQWAAWSDGSQDLVHSNSHGTMLFEDKPHYWEPADQLDRVHDQLAQNKCREIPQEELTFTEVIDSGEFGTVSRAMWKMRRGGRMDVAVKLLKTDASKEDMTNFLEEGARMMQFFHTNVVKLHGMVTVGPTAMLVFELMPKGDLKNYLTKLRYEKNPPPPSQLLRFGKDIALGMRHLAKKGFVHRDLIARNIFLNDSLICKIGNFGMTRAISHIYDKYEMYIPLRWTAPEAFTDWKYTEKSDVYSYGMVLFEIWSIGCKPLPSHDNNTAMQFIKQGGVQYPPPGCPRGIYELMIHCWNPNYRERHSFAAICEYLSVPDDDLLIWLLAASHFQDMTEIH